MNTISKDEYLKNPCEASSLPFWKTEQYEIPDNISILRDNELNQADYIGVDNKYFKLIHYLQNLCSSELSDKYILTDASVEELANHINECYVEEGVSFNELEEYTKRITYDEELWISIREKSTGKIIASGIGEFDARIGEGILDWIQVSPNYKRNGLGRVIVCELLKRLSAKADFATVSGRIDNPDNPFALYSSCGFVHPVLWHILIK